MALVNKNEYGIIAINNSAITKMVVANLLNLEAFLIPCNKKGKPLHSGRFAPLKDYSTCVEIKEFNEELYVKVYIIAKFGESIGGFTEILFDEIEKDFTLIGLARPKEICINVKGVMSKQLMERDVEILRVNEDDA